ncbi:MAG: hypothetical protein OHK0029_16870 [Armatimonadaceae bacterium]
MERYPRNAQIYIRTIITLGIAALLFALWMWLSNPHHSWLILVGVGLSVLVSFRKDPVVKDRHSVERHSHISLGLLPTLLMLILHGPFAAMVTAAVNTVIASLYPQRSQIHQMLFSIGVLNLSVLAAAGILQAFGFQPILEFGAPIFVLEWHGQSSLANTLKPYLAVALSTGAYYLLNTTLIAHVIALCGTQPTLKIWRENYAWMWPSYYAGSACAAFVVALIPMVLAGEGIFKFVPLLVLALPVPVLMLMLHGYHWENRMKQEEHIEALEGANARLQESQAELERTNTELQERTEELEEANSKLQESKEQLQKMFHSTIKSLALAIDAKDSYTREHIQRVSDFAAAIGRAMELSSKEQDALVTAALLHDIGKIAIPEQILNKPGRLEKEEMERIREHPDWGARILAPVEFPNDDVIPAVRSHHERWDGTGYPQGLKGDNIVLGGRILAVADVFDALITDRAYRPGWTEEEALAYIRNSSGSHFDPAVVDAFFRVLEESPRLHEFGVNLELSDPPLEPSPVQLANLDRYTEFSLHEISQTISSKMTVAEILPLLTVKVRQLFNSTDCMLLLLDDAGNPVSHHWTGEHAALFADDSVRLGNGYTRRTIRELITYCGSFDSEDLIFTTGSEGSKQSALSSALVAPLMIGDNVIGTLHVYQKRDHAFDVEDRKVMLSVAEQVICSIRSAEEYELTKKSVYTDDLTNLPNRQHLKQTLLKEIAQASAHERPLGVVALDLDNFKAFNEQYGRAVGNQVLRDVGRLLQQLAGANHYVARYPGDEFVVILPGQDCKTVLETSEKIRTAIATYRCMETYHAPIQASVGVAVFPQNGSDPASLIAVADRMMYQEKCSRKLKAVLETDAPDTERSIRHKPVR